MGASSVAPTLSRLKYIVGRNLRKFGVEYSRNASVQMWRERGDRLANQGRRDEELNCRRKAVELAPGNRDLRTELVRAFVIAGCTDEIRNAEGLNILMRLLGVREYSRTRPDRRPCMPMKPVMR